MDQIIVGIIVVGAAAYLFWRFRSTLKKKDLSCGCGSCGSSCSSADPEGGSALPLNMQGGNGEEERKGDR